MSSTPDSKTQSVDINQILLDRISALERENYELKEQVAKLKGEKLAYGRIHRHPSQKPSTPLYTTAYEGAYTVPEIWKRTVDKYKNDKAMGYRVLKGIRKEKKEVDGVTKEWDVMDFDDKMRWMSYKAVDKMITSVGSGLVNWANLKHGDRIGIYLDTRREWTQTAMACFQHGISVATCYANLGEDALVHVINECEIECMVTDYNLIPNLHEIADRCPTLKKVVYVGITETDHKTDKFEMISFGTLTKDGSKNRIRPQRPPERDDTAVIMYTSGSTGTPKGVVLTHQNIVSTSGALSTMLELSNDDCFLAYLPLAHIFELAAELCMLTNGVRVGYGSPKTLTDKFATPCGDIEAIQPSIFVGVPRVYETIRKGIIQKVNNGGLIKKKLFERALDTKLKALKNNQTTPFWDALVFNKIKAKAGLSNLRLMLSGGAPLSANTMKFLKAAFGGSVVSAYGLTETCAGSCVQDPTQFSTGRVGFPVPCCEIRLEDVKDMGYFHSEGKGEICIRGNSVAKGYYKNPEKTKEVFVNGWFKTGDIGQWNPDGSLSIIDRKKNLVKLSFGEYISLEALETIYNQSPFIAPNGICIYADPESDFAVALIQPQMQHVQSWAKENGIEGDKDELINNSQLKSTILENLKDIAIENKKKKFEWIQNLYITEDEWSPENGALTASMKLQRQNIYKMWKDQIKKMYEKGSYFQKKQ